MPKTIRTILVLTLLAVLPAAAALAGETGQDDETVTEKKVRRVVVAPVDGDLQVLADEESGDDAEVRVFVRRVTQEGEGGEPEVKTFAWKTEDGELVELEGEPGHVFIAEGAERGYLGVLLTDITPELRRHFGAREDYGVLVSKVVEDSPAERAGLKVGDVLTHVDGEPVGSSFEVTTRIGARKGGEVAALEVVRDGKVDTLSATLETRERPQIEVGRLLRRLPHGEGFSYEFDPETFEVQMREMRQYFEGPEWEAKMEQMDENIRKRLEELDVEIEGLEDEIDVQVRVEEEGKGDGD